MVPPWGLEQLDCGADTPGAAVVPSCAPGREAGWGARACETPGRGPILLGPMNMVTGLVLVQHEQWHPVPSLLWGVLVPPQTHSTVWGVRVCPQHPPQSPECLHGAVPLPHPCLHPIPVAPLWARGLPGMAGMGAGRGLVLSLGGHPMPRCRHRPCWERASRLGPGHPPWPAASQGGGKAGRAAGPCREHQESSRSWSACPGGGDGQVLQDGVPIPRGCDSGCWDASCTTTMLPVLGPRPRASPELHVPRGGGSQAGDGSGHAAWEPDSPWARLRLRFLPRPRGLRRRGLRSERSPLPRQRRQHDLDAQILFSTGEGEKKKGRKEKPGTEWLSLLWR